MRIERLTMKRPAPAIPRELSKEARRLLAEQERLIEDIDRYLRQSDSLSNTAEEGLLGIEKKLVREIEDIERGTEPALLREI
jgi:uncharacterized protein Yka (UPF0111/DUF47 family)